MTNKIILSELKQFLKNLLAIKYLFLFFAITISALLFFQSLNTKRHKYYSKVSISLIDSTSPTQNNRTVNILNQIIERPFIKKTFIEILEDRKIPFGLFLEKIKEGKEEFPGVTPFFLKKESHSNDISFIFLHNKNISISKISACIDVLNKSLQETKRESTISGSYPFANGNKDLLEVMLKKSPVLALNSSFPTHYSSLLFLGIFIGSIIAGLLGFLYLDHKKNKLKINEKSDKQNQLYLSNSTPFAKLKQVLQKYHLDLAVFPLLLLAIIFGNQPLYLYSFKASIIFTSTATIIAGLYLFICLSAKLQKALCFIVPTLLILSYLLLPISKVLPIINWIALAVFCFHGVYVYLTKKQQFISYILVAITVNLIFVLAQAYGVSPWAQVFTGLEHDFPGAWDRTFSILSVSDMTLFLKRVRTFTSMLTLSPLFFPEEIIRYSMIQYRPAGIVHANNILSFFILIGFALNYHIKGYKHYYYSIILCVLMVFSMAKIVALGFACLSIYLVFLCRGIYYTRVAFAFIVSLLTLQFYKITLPAYYNLSISLDSILSSISTRLKFAVCSVPDDSAVGKVLSLFFSNATQSCYRSEEQVQSLYLYIIPISFLILCVFIAIFIWNIRKGRVIKITEDANPFISLSIVLMIIPLSIPALVFAKIYWYFLGVCLIPFALNKISQFISASPMRSATK